MNAKKSKSAKEIPAVSYAVRVMILKKMLPEW